MKLGWNVFCTFIYIVNRVVPREIYTTVKQFSLTPAVTAWTNLTSAAPTPRHAKHQWAGSDGYGRSFFGWICARLKSGIQDDMGKEFDWSFRDISERCLLRICNTEFHHKGSWVIGKWLKIKCWQSSPGNMSMESFKCLLCKQHCYIEKKHCSFSIPSKTTLLRSHR